MINNIKWLYQKNKVDIAVIFFLILIVLLVVGMWRLNQVRPEKQPIRIEGAN